MKTKTWIVLLSALLVLSLAGSFFLLRPQSAATHAEITSPGSGTKIVDLRIDDSFYVFTPSGGHNLITIRDGKIAVTEATCPDHYCMERGFCDSGTPIVCLPNKLVITFLDSQEIDISVG